MSAGTIADTDVLIVGGGVTGCALAFFLAREGVETILIDRADFGTEASGRNAGSLHQQLMPAILRMSPVERAGKIAALPVFAAAVGVWRELDAALDSRVELKITGGLMVAETDAQMRLIEDKIAIERAKGIDAEILGRDDVRRLAPYFSERVIGGELCPAEGKINPLAAIPALVRGAEAKGARVRRNAELRAVVSEGASHVARTDAGDISCRRLVNCAGPWSADVSRLLGIALPIERKFVQSHVTEAVAPFIDHLVYHVERVLTLKQVANGNLVIGGGWRGAVDPDTGEAVVSRRSLEGNLHVARQVVPSIANLRLLRAWTGANISSDGMPVLGEVPGRCGIFHAVPSDAGMTIGPVCAQLTAELLTRRRPSLDIGAFGIERFASRTTP